MKIALRIAAVGGLLAATMVGQVAPAPAASDTETLLDGTLANPRGLTFDATGNLYIAESGSGGDSPCTSGPEGGYSCYGETGAITKVTDVEDAANTASQIITGLPSLASADDPDTPDAEPEGYGAAGPADASVTPDGTFVYFSIGFGGNPAARDEAPLEGAGKEDMFGTVNRAALDGTVDGTWSADIAQYEADNNPDQGAGAEEGQEIDSNPFGVSAGNTSVDVLDSGGNFQASVSAADATDISTTAVFPTVTTVAPDFLGAPVGTRLAAQAVPTQLVADPDGGHIVGQLTGFPFQQGASDVTHTNGDVSTLLEGFTNVMDVAWHGNDLFVLEFAHGGLLAGTPGALTRVDLDSGTRELLADDLPSPGGIAFGPDGMAYITTGSDTPEGSLVRMDVDNAPVIMSVTDDTATTTEDDPVEIDALVNDADGAVLRSLPDNSEGAIWEGSVMYQPKAHFAGSDSITYEACSSDAEDADCLIGVIDVTVTAQDVDRIDGATRIQTAADASRALYPDGAPVVVIAYADKYPDALAGAPLAKFAGGPILLNPSNTLHPDVATEINRLGATTAYILGGDVSIEPQVETMLKDQTSITTIDRIGGAERFSTAKLIKDKIEELTGEPATDVYVTEGIDDDPARGWPDAMSVSSLAAHEVKPILITRTESLPAPTKEALQGVSSATIVGGPVSVSDDVRDEIDDRVPDVFRIWGQTRYGTSLAVAQAAVDAGMSPNLLWLASGGNWPDALVIGPLVAVDGGVMMLVHPDDLNDSPQTRSFIEEHDPFTDIDLAGGPNTIHETVKAQIEALVK